ncbi:MAG: hypothetical protein WD534_18580 [Phycisphaeraceae bacterium]
MTPSPGTRVVRGEHLGTAGLAAFAPGIAPEFVAAVTAFQDARQEPPPIAMPGPALRAATLDDHGLGLVPVLAGDNGGHGVGHDQPLVLGRLDDLGLAELALPLLRPTLLHAVELRLGASVPHQIATVRRVLHNGLDGGVAPHVAQRAGDAPSVQRGGDGAEADAVEAHGEDVFHHLHPLRIAEHQPGLALLAGLGQRLAFLVPGLQFAVLVVDLTNPARAEADAEQHRAVGGEHLPVVAIRCGSTGVGLGHDGADLTAQRVLAETDRILAVLELLDRPQHIAIDAVAIQIVLGDREHFHVGPPQQVAVVLGLGDIATREAIRVPDDHGLEVARLSVGHHPLKVRTLLGTGAADGIVHILADHPVAMLLGVAHDLKALVAEALFLLVGGAPQVGDGGDGLRAGGHGRLHSGQSTKR